MPNLDADVQQALSEIEEVLTRNIEILTRECPDIEGAQVMLGDWGVVYYVADMNEPSSGWLESISAPHMAYHHWIGLLRTALKREEADDGTEEDE